MKVISSMYRQIYDNVYECQDQYQVIGQKVKLTTAFKEYYRRIGATLCLDRCAHPPHTISGLIPLFRRCKQFYYGDYHGETIAVIMQPTTDIKVYLFRGHIPKYNKSRRRKVRSFLIQLKRTTP